VRRDEPPITEVKLLNPRLTPERLSGKHLILDLRAIDEHEQHYTIEMQVRRFAAWNARGILYLARLLSEQLDTGQDYRRLNR
jgi:predicted transposase/invertase (TIGR01784 family)